MKITVYTKDYCPYCVLAKNLLTQLNVVFEEINITHDSAAFDALKERSNLMTVPQIFAGDTLLGGYTDIAKLQEEGTLLSKLGIEK